MAFVVISHKANSNDIPELTIFSNEDDAWKSISISELGPITLSEMKRRFIPSEPGTDDYNCRCRVRLSSGFRACIYEIETEDPLSIILFTINRNDVRLVTNYDNSQEAAATFYGQITCDISEGKAIIEIKKEKKRRIHFASYPNGIKYYLFDLRTVNCYGRF